MTQCQMLEITPRDPLVARDGRPFGAGQGNRMRSGDWLLPSVVAGSLRTLLGKQLDGSFDDAMVVALKATSVSGPFPTIDNKLFFPRPADAVVKNDKGRLTILSIRPSEIDRIDCGYDLPAGTVPALLPISEGDDFKPVRGPAFWSIDRMTDWLTDETGLELATEPFKKWDAWNYIIAIPQEERAHVKIVPNFGAASDGDLFSTCALDFSRINTCACDINDGLENTFSRTDDEGVIKIALLVRPDAMFEGETSKLNLLHPCGGERRLVQWKADSKVDWSMPASLKAAFEKADRSGSRRLRLVLATPGLFVDQDGMNQGWKPGWLHPTDQGQLEGCPLGASLTLRLVSAIVDRWRPISGWSLERGAVGPKPVRRMVPAGATYFFDAIGHAPLADFAKDLWLRSVCDNEQDQRDGFGVALWGLWNHHLPEKK